MTGRPIKHSLSILLCLLFVCGSVLHPLFHHRNASSDELIAASYAGPGSEMDAMQRLPHSEESLHASREFCPVCAGLVSFLLPGHGQESILPVPVFSVPELREQQPDFSPIRPHRPRGPPSA